MKLTIIDRYIIRKFLGTFFFAISLLIIIVIIFDISEKIDDFITKQAPLQAIIFDYYLNFIPFFINLFSNLFTFIAVVFFYLAPCRPNRNCGHAQRGNQLQKTAAALHDFSIVFGNTNALSF